MKKWLRAGTLCLTLTLLGCDNTAQSDRQSREGPVETFSIGITSDMINLPWRYASRHGLLANLERQHGIRLDTVEFANERRALQAYDNGDIDAITTSLNAIITSIELSQHETHIPLIFGFSRGDYGIFSRDAERPQDLRGKTIHAPLGSSGHYFLFRILELNQLTLGDVELVDTQEENIIDGLISGEIENLIASGPTFAQLMQLDDVRLVADSRSLFGEVMAGVAIDSKTLNDHPALGEMLVASWFLIADRLFVDDRGLTPASTEALEQLSNIPAERLEQYLGPHNFLRTPDYVYRYMSGENLQPALLGTERFRIAANIYQCTERPMDDCGITRDGNLITNSEGARILLDTRFVENMIPRD